MNGEELPALQAIERFIGQKIPRLKLENFPYKYTALFEPEVITGGKRAIGGGPDLPRLFLRQASALSRRKSPALERPLPASLRLIPNPSRSLVASENVSGLSR